MPQPPVCRYFVSGTCNRGSDCRFLHPSGTQNIGKERQSYGKYEQKPPVQENAKVTPEDVLFHDLKEIKMDWPLTCYGLNVSWTAGDNILHGDFSPEELRLEAYQQRRHYGNINAYQHTLQEVMARQEAMKQMVLSSPTQAIQKARIPRYRADGSAIAGPAHSGAPQPVMGAEPSAPVIKPLATYDTRSTQFIQSQRLDAIDSFTFGDIPELPPLS